MLPSFLPLMVSFPRVATRLRLNSEEGEELLESDLISNPSSAIY